VHVVVVEIEIVEPERDLLFDKLGACRGFWRIDMKIIYLAAAALVATTFSAAAEHAEHGPGVIGTPGESVKEVNVEKAAVAASGTSVEGNSGQASGGQQFINDRHPAQPGFAGDPDDRGGS
jgi:hypothetical protein